MLLRKTYNNIDKFRSFIYHRAAGYPARGAGPCCAAGSALWSREAGKRLLNAPGRRNLCRGEQCCEETSWFNHRRRPSAFLVGLCRRGGPRSRGGSSSLLTSASRASTRASRCSRIAALISAVVQAVANRKTPFGLSKNHRSSYHRTKLREHLGHAGCTLK